MQTFLLGLRYLFIDLVGGIIKWPIWWYTKGFAFVLKGGISWISTYSKSLALNVWLKNLFVPMYGMNDWQSRLISIFMRLVQIVFRAIGVLLLSVVVLAAVLLYLALPPLTIVSLIYQFIALYA